MSSFDDFRASHKRPLDVHDDGGHVVTPAYTLVRIRVAGVTFKNGRRSRQTILREIFWKDEPYQHVDPEHCIDLVKAEVEGEPAIEVWVHSKTSREQIGYVPREHLPFLLANWERYNTSHTFEVYGGGSGENGGSRYFGASFTCSLHNSPQNARLYEQAQQAEEQRISQLWADREKLHAPYKRAIELFFADYPEYAHCKPVYDTASEHLDVRFCEGGVEKYYLRYYPEEDAIRAYTIVDGRLASLPWCKHSYDQPSTWDRICNALPIVIIVAVMFFLLWFSSTW